MVLIKLTIKNPKVKSANILLRLGESNSAREALIQVMYLFILTKNNLMLIQVIINNNKNDIISDTIKLYTKQNYK